MPVIVLCSKFSYLRLPRFIVYFCGCSAGCDFVFSVLVKRLAGKSISEISCFVVRCKTLTSSDALLSLKTIIQPYLGHIEQNKVGVMLIMMTNIR